MIRVGANIYCTFFNLVFVKVRYKPVIKSGALVFPVKSVSATVWVNFSLIIS